MSYDNRNRLQNSWWNTGGGPTVTYTYDAARAGGKAKKLKS